MNSENINMELIYLVIDGEASDIERATFFTALAENQELQNEFQTALRMSRAAESFPQKSFVPLAVSEKLFNKAGLVYIPSETAITAVASILNTSVLSSFKSKIIGFSKGKIALVLIGIIIGIGMMYLLDENSDNFSKINSEITNNLCEFVFVEPKSEIPVMSSISSEPIASSHSKTIANSSFENSNKKNIFSLEDVKLESEFKEEVKLYDSQIFQDKNRIEMPKSEYNTDFRINNIENFENTLLNYEYFGIFFEVKKSNYWNLPEETVYPNETSRFNNYDIFAYFEVSPQFSIGAGVRQETFFAKYKTTQSNSEYLYEQQPNLTNFEITMRYIPYEISFLKTLIQLNFGGGIYGYTYRGSIGSMINVYENLGIVLSLDYATFSYINNTNIHNSSKVGINYGINFKF